MQLKMLKYDCRVLAHSDSSATVMAYAPDTRQIKFRFQNLASYLQKLFFYSQVVYSDT